MSDHKYPWHKQGDVAAATVLAAFRQRLKESRKKQRVTRRPGDELPYAPKTIARSSEEEEIDYRQEVEIEIGDWQKRARDEIEAAGGLPAHYSQIVWEGGAFNRPQAAAHLLIQLDRLGLRLRDLDQCKMSGATRERAFAAVHEALLTLYVLRDFVLMRNETAIGSNEKRNASLDVTRPKKIKASRDFKAWCIEAAEPLRSRGLKINSIAKILAKHSKAKGAKKGGYSARGIRNIISQK
jgi:hypothetical protein